MKGICLQALGVPLVLGSALGARSAGSGTSVSLTAALSVLLSGGTAGNSSRSGLSDGSKGGSSLGGGRRSDDSLCCGSGGSGSLGGGRSRRGSSTGTVPELRTGYGVPCEATVDVEENTSVLGLNVAGDSDTGGKSSGA